MISPKPIRLWPGLIGLVLLCIARFGVKAVVPGFGGFALGMQWTLGIAGFILVWWMFFSRVRWLDRLGILVLMVAGVGTASLVRHPSMGPFWLFAYVVPTMCIALVVAATVTRGFPEGRRRAVMAAIILLASGVWTLVRMDGISGDHVARFGWRWARSPEERLLARAVTSDSPVAPPVVPSAPPPKEQPAVVQTAAPAVRMSAPAAVTPRVEWPGFRGPDRDGLTRGIRIETNWSASPPVAMWRRPIGPGWSSFAVRGDLIYTQEQRGDDEVVACYRASTGAPVWVHRDAARFFEANAGAGPRGTPTLSGDRLYTFGATGIANALDATSGALIWSRDAAADTEVEVPYWGFSSSPLVVDDVVIVAVYGRLIGYDVATGKPRWLGPTGAGSYSSPQLATIEGIAQVVLMGGEGARSLSPADGKLLWEHRWRGLPIVQPAMTSDGGLLISASSESGTRRLAVGHGAAGWTVEERWTSTSLKPYFNDFVVHNGHAFGFDGRILACIDLQDGARKWKGGRYGNGQLILLPEQDLLLVLTEEGELALVKATPDQFTELARLPAIQGKTWNHPVLVGNVLLVRNSEEMAAFRLTRASQ
jgi:outer membrane protein assembly factor BamB